MKGRVAIVVSIFLLCCTVALLGQQTSIEALQKQIEQAEKEIKINTDLLTKTLSSQKLSQSQLKVIRTRIANRKQIVSSLEKQIQLIEADISSKNSTIKSLNKSVEKVREEYADMVRTAYKEYKLNNFMLFLFDSEDFNDATRRVDFMRRYNRQRQAKGEQIRAMADSLEGKITDLDRQRVELDNTKKTKGSELTSLAKDETQYKGSVAKLKAEEGKINKQLKAKRAIIDEAQKSIQRIVAEEAKKSKSEVRTAAQDKYITELSGRFDDNIGKLPYPVSGGVIIDRYGSHSHPTQVGMIINNKGVNIAGTRGVGVTSVFEGSVTKIFSLKGLNNCIIVRHGDYITLYANLATVVVKTGDKVTINQRLGALSSSDNDDDNYLHFEVWRETVNLNPESWLRR